MTRPIACAMFVILFVVLAPAGPLSADCPGLEVPFPAGAEDDFALPSEPTDASPEFVEYMDSWWPQPTTREFDTGGSDAALIHTFTGWLGPVCGARLEIRLRAGSSPLATNDSVRLGLVGGSDPVFAFRYWTTIRNVTGTWDDGAIATLDLDLSDLPPYVSFPTNILSELADGRLELAVEDDTAVDYATMYVCYCPVSVAPETWGRVKSLYR